ncbi:MAG: ABC transporter substrate-binding protein [Pseudomonas sp.]
MSLVSGCPAPGIRASLLLSALGWAGLLLLSCLATACSRPQTSHLETHDEVDAAAAASRLTGGSIVLAASDAKDRLDPHIDTSWEVLYVLSAVYDTLIYQAPDGRFVAGLARDWQVADDGLRYRFELRSDVHFHDGTRFDASAVKFNFDRILALGPRSMKAAGLIAAVDHVDVVDATTVDVHLKRRDSGFLFALSLPYLGMVSPTAVRRWGDDYHRHQVGTGAFRITEYVPGDHYTLERNPDYTWGPSLDNHPGPAWLERIIWRFLPEPATRAPALRAGDVDMAIDLLPTDVGQVHATPGLEVVRAPLAGQTAYWFMNTRKFPTDDLRVRQALLYGTDMATGVRAILRGQNPPAVGPLSATTQDFARSPIGGYHHDPARANALLDAAGWTQRDADGYRMRAGTPLTISVAVQPWGMSPTFSILLQSELRSLGIRVELEQMEFAVAVQAARDGRDNLAFFGGSGFSASDSLYPYFHSSNIAGGFAWSKHADPVLDRLLETGAAAISPRQRHDNYVAAQERIMEQALILPIYDFTLLIGKSTRIGGLQWRSVGIVPSFHDMYLVGPAPKPAAPSRSH